MLLSLRHRFVFLSNMKAASTTVETTLQRFAELHRVYPRNTKHLSLSQLRMAFPAIFSTPGGGEDAFVRFGVIRDPLSWVCAWFNYRSNPVFADPDHALHDRYCGHVSFREFAAEAVKPAPRPFARLRLQSELLSTNGTLDCHFIIDFDRFEEDFLDLLDVLGLRARIEKILARNASRAKRIDPGQIDWSAYDALLDYLERDFVLRDRYLRLRENQREACDVLREAYGELSEAEIAELLSMYWESFAASVLHGPTKGVPTRELEREIAQLDKRAFLREHLPVSAPGAS